MTKSAYDLLISNSKLKSALKFHEDLKTGESGEQYVEKILTGKEFKLEAKLDLKALGTGNLCIEFKSRNRDSGIRSTQSDFYAFNLKGLLIIFPTDFLRKVCEELCQNSKYVRYGGDKNKAGKGTAVMVLLPWDEVLTRYSQYISSLENNSL